MSSTIHNLLVENPITQQVGERVARVRTQMQMTQSELAAEMSARLGREIRPLTVTRLEGGKRPIGVDELVVAAEALHVKPEDLLSDTSLPMGALTIISAYQALLRSANQLETSVREYVSAQSRLADALDGAAGKYLDRLPAMTRMFVAAAAEWTVDFVVAQALEEEADDDDAKA